MEGTQMKVSIEGKELVIRMDLEEPTPSASGKTMVVASSHGNVTTSVLVQGKPLVLGINAYIKK
jgi:hypothetical protein